MVLVETQTVQYPITHHLYGVDVVGAHLMVHSHQWNDIQSNPLVGLYSFIFSCHHVHLRASSRRPSPRPRPLISPAPSGEQLPLAALQQVRQEELGRPVIRHQIQELQRTQLHGNHHQRLCCHGDTESFSVSLCSIAKSLSHKILPYSSIYINLYFNTII